MKKALVAVILSMMLFVLCSCGSVPMQEDINQLVNTLLSSEDTTLFFNYVLYHDEFKASDFNDFHLIHYHYNGRETIEKQIGCSLDDVFINYQNSVDYPISAITIPDSGHIFIQFESMYLFDEDYHFISEVNSGRLNNEVTWRNSNFNSKVDKINQKAEMGLDTKADREALTKYTAIASRLATHAVNASKLLVASSLAPEKAVGAENEWHQLTTRQLEYFHQKLYDALK